MTCQVTQQFHYDYRAFGSCECLTAIRNTHALFEARKREAALQRLLRNYQIHRNRLEQEDDDEEGWSS